MKFTLIAATLALGFAVAAPAFAETEGRFGDSDVEAPNSNFVRQGSSLGGQVTVQDGNVLNSFPGQVQSPIDNGQG